MKETNYFIEGLIAGDEMIVNKIYDRVFPTVQSFVINNKGHRADAQDIFQKALLQIVARVQIRKFKINSSFEAYMFVACKNLWRRELNKRKRLLINDMSLEQGTDERELALSVLEQERWEFFQEKLEEISDNCKKVLKRFFNKIPYKIIADELGYNNESVVRQRVFKCKSKLTEIIKADARFKQLKEI